MTGPGWKQLLDGAPWFEGPDSYPVAAYSEFMPAPRLGLKPYRYSRPDPLLFQSDDAHGWYVTEYEEELELRPGLLALAEHLLHPLTHLCRGEPAHGLPRVKLADNPFWPPNLAQSAGSLPHERYVLLLPLALSRTQDDKGRVRWTLFGNSEQGPGKSFWRGFFTAPGREVPGEEGLGFFLRLLNVAYGESPRGEDLRRAGFRILTDDAPLHGWWEEGQLPSWAQPLVLRDGELLRGVRYLLSFRPFGRLPRLAQQAYLDGRLHLLPFPGSLVFWGAPGASRLAEELPLALQTPLLPLVPRHEAPHGLRVPQSGWMHVDHPDHPRPDEAHYGPVRNSFRRTNRFAAVLRDQDEIALIGRDDLLLHTLFSSLPDDCGLYNKPMARNVQLWTTDFRLLLDGPSADRESLRNALRTVEAGGLFGYRFLYPAMRVGRHEVYWHRPLVAYLDSASGKTAVLLDAPLGYLTAYRADKPRLDRPVELWPRLLRREVPLAALSLLGEGHTPAHVACTRRVRQVYDAWQLGGREPLPKPLARQLMRLAHKESLDDWLAELPGRFTDAGAGRVVASAFENMLAADSVEAPTAPESPASLTFEATATRSFEVTYWRTIARLATGQFVNKNNGDCVRDPVTQRHLTRHVRDLEALGDHLLAYYARTIADAGMTGRAVAGEVPFVWHTDWDFSWMGGWLHNQEGRTHERDLLVVIPGRDRSRAVLMGDHYDTAYMADLYERKGKGRGPRLATPGADDNHSATAALMLAAPVLLELSKAGKLGCDVWLVHLTGEEFPADCLGARNLSQRIVEGTLRLRVPGRKPVALSGVRVQGVYVLDMIAHNRNNERDVFQIAPGTSRQSLWLAEQAHVANQLWNAAVPVWNRRPARRGKGRSVRAKEGTAPPPTAAFRRVSGEVRTASDPRSTLYNTDGQIFSDVGIPVVLFMENYDINRSGYHDTEDTLANIDLDYGSAVAAIAIESVARAATESPPA